MNKSLLLAVLLSLSLGALLTGCGQSEQTPAAAPTAPATNAPAHP